MTQKAIRAGAMPNMQKSILPSSRKTRKSGYEASKPCQKNVMKQHHGTPVRLSLERLKTALGQMANRLAVGGKVKAYEQIAAQLSVLAGLGEDHIWGWRYVASVHSGTVVPSRKFMRALALLIEHVNPRQKQWFYFARRKSVASFYDKTVLREMIFSRMRELGYKPVTFSRYTELKRRKA